MGMEKVALPFVGMVMAEFAQVGLMIVGKEAMSKGMSNLVFIFYSNAFASLILLPSALLFHRSQPQRPRLSFCILWGFFLLGLFGFLAQAFGYAGILYSSPTLATAILNLIPAFTFILAVTFRKMGMEKVALPFLGMVMAEFAQVGLMIVGKEAMSKGMSNLVFIFYSNAFASLILLPSALLFHRSQPQRPRLSFCILWGFFLLGLFGFLAQAFGYAGILYSSPTLATAILNLIPAFTFILAVTFRMEKLDWRSSNSQVKIIGTIISISGAFIVTLYKGLPLLMTPLHSNSSHKLHVQMSNWVIGGLLLAADAMLGSTWLILQAWMLKKYPAELIVVFFYCFFVAIQSAMVSLVVERDLSSWSLQPNMRLIAVLYSAVFGSAFQVGISAWCLHKTGPLFVAMFKPVGIVISVFIGVIFLGDTFYLGSLIGAILIVVGFYCVMWGKAKEQRTGEETRIGGLESSREKVPLLQNRLTILAKTAMTNGMSPFVFVVYTNAIASIIILFPYSFIFHCWDRTEQQSLFTFPLLLRLFFLGLTGITVAQNFAFVGLSYSSPILICAMGLLIPAFSFMLSLILRFSLNFASVYFQIHSRTEKLYWAWARI
ncbi:wat1-related protein [Quercus suber]|uniref:Wat1-related protein n=1 Tax=Quercus suber TaxID=58331 RepID=A0AAW0MCN4_QUESU